MSTTMKFIQAVTDEQLILIKKLAEVIWPVAFKGMVPGGQIRYMIDWMYDLELMRRQIAENTTYQLIYIPEEVNPVGFCGYTVYKDDNFLKLDKVYVHTDYQGRGVGKAILEHAQEFSVCQKVGSVILATNKKNLKGIKFYKKNNFKIIKSVKNDIGNGFFMDDYILERKNNGM